MTKCAYIGQGTAANHLAGTCSHSAAAGHSYCAEHLAVVYKQGTARSKRHKELRTVDKVRLVESLMNEAIAELEAQGFDCYGTGELDQQLVFGGAVEEEG